MIWDKVRDTRQKALVLTLVGFLIGWMLLPLSAIAGFHAYVSANTLDPGTPLERLVAYPYTGDNAQAATPLFLIHGIGGQQDNWYNWKRFLDHTTSRPAFNQRYHIYLYHYDSHQPLDKLGVELQATLRTWIDTHPGRNFSVLAHSEGGLVLRQALEDPIIQNHLVKAITIGTPFHGSPLANPTWLKSQLATEPWYKPVKVGYEISYKITQKLYPYFEGDFAWDNIDHALAKGTADPSPLRSAQQLSAQNKIVAYASFFDLNPDAETQLKNVLEVPVLDDAGAQHPKNWLSRHVLFTVIHDHIANMPMAWSKTVSKTVAKAARKTAHTMAHRDPTLATPALLRADATQASPEPVLSMMAYNDGISPISSALWLGRFELGPNPADAGLQAMQPKLPVAGLWRALASLKGTHRARLFASMDHRNWMEGETRTGKTQIADLLNPQDPPRNVFDWLIDDLMS
jgi:pimeloyl-ACP methyl ester carboxylesterase